MMIHQDTLPAPTARFDRTWLPLKQNRRGYSVSTMIPVSP